MDRKIIDFFEYYNNSVIINKVQAMVSYLHPKIEEMLDSEIAKMMITKEEYNILKNDADFRDHVDLTIITSLCYLLTQYLIPMTQRENVFNITEATVETYVINIIKSTFKTFLGG